MMWLQVREAEVQIEPCRSCPGPAKPNEKTPTDSSYMGSGPERTVRASTMSSVCYGQNPALPPCKDGSRASVVLLCMAGYIEPMEAYTNK